MPDDGPDLEQKQQQKARNAAGHNVVSPPGPPPKWMAPSDNSSSILPNTDIDAPKEANTDSVFTAADGILTQAPSPHHIEETPKNQSQTKHLLEILVSTEPPEDIKKVVIDQVPTESSENDNLVIKQLDSQAVTIQQQRQVNSKNGNPSQTKSADMLKIPEPQEYRDLNSNGQIEIDSASLHQDVSDVNSIQYRVDSGASQPDPGVERVRGGPTGMDQSSMTFQTGPRSPSIQYQTESFRFQQAITRAFAEMPLEERIALGTQIEDFILDCEYAGFPCNMR